MSDLIGLGALAISWLAITTCMLLLYLLVVGPGLERLRDAALRSIRPDVGYDDMHRSDVVLGVVGLLLVVGVGPVMVLGYSGLVEWSMAQGVVLLPDPYLRATT